jgi:hypothetical protein
LAFRALSETVSYSSKLVLEVGVDIPPHRIFPIMLGIVFFYESNQDGNCDELFFRYTFQIEIEIPRIGFLSYGDCGAEVIDYLIEYWDLLISPFLVITMSLKGSF